MRVLLSLLLVSASQAHDVCLRWNASTTLACNVSTPCTFLTHNTSSCSLSVDLNETIAPNSSWLGNAFERRPSLARLIPHYDNEDDYDEDEDDEDADDDHALSFNGNGTLPWTLWLSWGGNASAYVDLEHLYSWSFNSSLSTDNTIVFPPHEHGIKKSYVLRRWKAFTNASMSNVSATPYPMIRAPRNASVSGRRTTPPWLARNSSALNETYVIDLLERFLHSPGNRSDPTTIILYVLQSLLETNGSFALNGTSLREMNDTIWWDLLVNATQSRNATAWSADTTPPLQVLRPLLDVIWRLLTGMLGGWSPRAPQLQRPANSTEHLLDTLWSLMNGTARNTTTATIMWPPASNRSSERPTMIPFRPLRPTPRPSRNDSGSGRDSGSDANASMPTITEPPLDAQAATGPAVTTSSSHVDAIVLSCVAVVAVGFLAARVYARRQNPEAYSNLQD